LELHQTHQNNNFQNHDLATEGNQLSSRKNGKDALKLKFQKGSGN